MNLTAKQKECLEVMENDSFVELTTIDNEFRQKVWQKGWELYHPKGGSDYSVLIKNILSNAEKTAIGRIKIKN